MLRRAFGCDRPQERRKAGQSEFGRHSCRGNHDLFLSVGQLPGFAHVGIQERPHDEESDAHCRHSHAVTLGRVRVTEFVEHLGESRRYREVKAALEIEKIRESPAQLIPLAGDQVQVDKEHQQHNGQETSREEQFRQRQRALEEFVGVDQRHAKEQVVVKQLLIPGLDAAHPAAAQPAAILLVARNEQLAAFKELDKTHNLILGRTQRRFGLDVRDEVVDLGVLGPAREQLELEPADLEKPVAHGIENAPARGSVAMAGTRIELDVFAELRDLGRLRRRRTRHGPGYRCELWLHRGH